MTSWYFRNVMFRTLYDARRVLVGYGSAVLLMALMTVLIWPTIRDQGQEFQDLLDNYPPAMRAAFGDFNDFTTPSGFLRTEYFSLMLPIVFLMFSIGRSSDAIGGEESRGALDLVLSLPISRARLVWQRQAGVALGLVVLTVFTAVAMVGAALLAGFDMDLWKIVGACLLLLAIGLCFAGISFATASAGFGKGASMGVASGIGLVGFLLNSIANASDDFEWMRYFSPFYYYQQASPLAQEFQIAWALVLLAVAVFCAPLSVRLLQRRDIRTAGG